MLRNQRLKYKARGASLSCLVTSHVTVGTREKKRRESLTSRIQWQRYSVLPPFCQVRGGGNGFARCLFTILRIPAFKLTVDFLCTKS